MIKSQNIAFFLFLLPLFVHGQNNEFGLFYGTSYYLGDLNPSKHFAMARFAYGGMYRYNIDEHKSLRINGYYGSVEANDAVIGYNENRNLHFQSSIIELSLQGEISFLPFKAGDLTFKHTPYIFGGIGGFKFNPRAKYQDEWYDLQPLGTEGQLSEANKEPYDLYAVSYIFGMGYKFNITNHLTGGFEWGMRRTSTDYLDDVSTVYPHPSSFEDESISLAMYDMSMNRNSLDEHPNTNMQRGNPKKNDWYSFAGFILTFRLPGLCDEDCPTSPYGL